MTLTKHKIWLLVTKWCCAETKGRIGSDGSVLLLEIGRLGFGKTYELQSEVETFNSKCGQSKISARDYWFQVKKAYLTINETTNVILLNDQALHCENGTTAKVGFRPGQSLVFDFSAMEKNILCHCEYFEKAPDILIYSVTIYLLRIAQQI